eukprot:g4116.t1
MCRHCAERALGPLLEAFPPGPSGWRICLIDHGAHVHIRVNFLQMLPDGSERIEHGEWVTVNSTWAVLAPLLPRGTLVHFHTNENKPKGCSDEVLDKIHCVTWGDCCTSEACSVCREHFYAKEEVSTLPCGHRFHKACVSKWLKQNATCPVCRFNITLESVSKIPEKAQEDQPTPLTAMSEESKEVVDTKEEVPGEDSRSTASSEIQIDPQKGEEEDVCKNPNNIIQTFVERVRNHFQI